MDSNYSWNQPEHNGPSQKIWSKAYEGILISKINKQSSSNLHNYPYFQNELPIHSACSPHLKDAWHNPPFRINDCSTVQCNDTKENYKLNDRKDLFNSQVIEFIKRKREYNKASTFGYAIQLQFQMISTVNSDIYPWNVKETIYQKNLDGLHEEILDFYQYIMPTFEEQTMRQEVVERLKKVVLKEWPEAIVDVFGSFKTELHLPTSDIDVVIFGKWDNPLWTLNDIIKQSGIASDCKVLDRATVPIVKMTDKETEVRIDISFNMENGIQSADLIKSFIKEYPQLPQLVLILKQYLLQRDLNEVWTGGISSYSLILMCVSFMKLRAMKNSPNQDNLGETLILFLEMYGRNFDYFNTGIRTEGDICHVPKEDLLKNMEGNHWSSILCIEDPLNPGNDIGRSSYGALHIKLAFDYAFTTLSRVVLPQSSHLFEKSISILGRIIRITPEVMRYREMIKKKFSKRALSEERTTLPTTFYSEKPPIKAESYHNGHHQTDMKKDNNNSNNNHKSRCPPINEQGDQSLSYAANLLKKPKSYNHKKPINVMVNTDGSHIKSNYAKVLAMKPGNTNNNSTSNSGSISFNNSISVNNNSTGCPMKKPDSDFAKHSKKSKVATDSVNSELN